MAQPGIIELAGPATPAAPTIGAPVGPGGRNQTITLAVENMTCGGCMRKVEKALLEVPGVASARANLSARRATVVFEEAQRTAAPLVDALGRVGFKAAELAPETLDSGQRHRPAASEPSGRGRFRRRQHHAAFGVGVVRLVGYQRSRSRLVSLALRRHRLARHRLCGPALSSVQPGKR